MALVHEPQPALIVFDLDGTLVDSSRDLANAVNAALKRIDPAAPELALDVVRSFIGSGARNLVSRSLAHAGVALPPNEALPVFLEEYTRRLTEHTRFYPGVEDTLDRLSAHPMAVLTNKPGDMSRQILDALGAGARFFRVYGGGDLPSRKPDPDGLLRLMAEAMATPRTTVMVGDSAIDVRTGRAAGARTVGVRYGFDPESLVTEPPDALFDSLQELPAFMESLRAAVLP
jgi:phosphoglycolate phosphatase